MSKMNLNDPIYRAVVEARLSMLFHYPFFGNLATRMEVVDATAWCPTAATDGRKLYFNREFVKKLSKKELLFLIAHEVLHAVYDHIGRRGHKDPKIWNMAIDYIVNWTLTNERIGEMPKNGLLSTKYTDEWASEQVYNDLIQNSTKIEMSLDMHLDPGEGDGDDEQDGEGDGSENGKGKTSGSGSGRKTVSVSVPGDENGPPKLTEEDLQRIRNEMRAAVISAAQVSAGKVPLGVRRLIAELTEPKMDWRAMLEAHISSMVRGDYTYRRFSKKTWASPYGIVLPGQDTLPAVDVVVAIDNSGSISDKMLKDFLSEVYGIMEQFQDFKLLLMAFDTQVYNPQTFTPENKEELLEYKIQGGGGTAFECVWDHLKSEDIVPERLVMLTDGYPNSTWGDENYCSTLFVIHGTKSIVAPFGQTAYYEE
jgi:predicted metal-dependent peptidase